MKKRFHGQVRSGDSGPAKFYAEHVHEGTRFQIGQPYMIIAGRRIAEPQFQKADFMVEHGLRRLPDGVSFGVFMAMAKGEIDGVAAAWAAGTTAAGEKEAKGVAPVLSGALREEIHGVYPAGRSGGPLRRRGFALP